MEPSTSFQKIGTTNTEDRKVQSTSTTKKMLYGFGGTISLAVSAASVLSINQKVGDILVQCKNTAGNPYAQVACLIDEVDVVAKVVVAAVGLFGAIRGFSSAFASTKAPLPAPTNGHSTNGHKAVDTAKSEPKPVEKPIQKPGMAGATRAARRKSGTQ